MLIKMLLSISLWLAPFSMRPIMVVVLVKVMPEIRIYLLPESSKSGLPPLKVTVSPV